MNKDKDLTAIEAGLIDQNVALKDRVEHLENAIREHKATMQEDMLCSADTRLWEVLEDEA